MKKESILQAKSFELAIFGSKVGQSLLQKNTSSILVNQLIKASSQLGLIITTSGFAPGKDAFIKKLKDSLQEAQKTEYWVEILHQSGALGETEYKSFLEKTEIIGKIIRKSLQTMKKQEV